MPHRTTFKFHVFAERVHNSGHRTELLIEQIVYNYLVLLPCTVSSLTQCTLLGPQQHLALLVVQSSKRAPLLSAFEVRNKLKMLARRYFQHSLLFMVKCFILKCPTPDACGPGAPIH